ncbi:translation initiation factor IF-2-like [Sturnira hondurensis]|uniref:translation initiation factor IF-2-like n=1 Tax=Sturnira hondurensis TaxID=192404 RepID=UPI00187A3AFD|nr:translation initiation factor IF-2-like [Sturnira hondurensis]
MGGRKNREGYLRSEGSQSHARPNSPGFQCQEGGTSRPAPRPLPGSGNCGWAGAGLGGGRGDQGGPARPRPSKERSAGQLGLGREDPASRRQRAPGAAVRCFGATSAGAERRGEARERRRLVPRIPGSGDGAGGGERRAAAERAGERASCGRARGPGSGRQCRRRDSAVPATLAPPPSRGDRGGPEAEPVPSATRAGWASWGGGDASPARALRLWTRNLRRCGARATAGKKLGRTASLRGPGRKCECRRTRGSGGRGVTQVASTGNSFAETIETSVLKLKRACVPLEQELGMAHYSIATASAALARCSFPVVGEPMTYQVQQLVNQSAYSQQFVCAWHAVEAHRFCTLTGGVWPFLENPLWTHPPSIPLERCGSSKGSPRRRRLRTRRSGSRPCRRPGSRSPRWCCPHWPWWCS